MTYFFQIVMSGVLVGSIYAMAALGFTIVFSATRVINFANGEFLVIGGLTLAMLTSGIWGEPPILVAIAAGMLAATLVAVAMQLLAIGFSRSRDPQMLVMLTIGITLMLRGAASLVFGRDIHFVTEFGGVPSAMVGGVFIQSQGVWILLSLLLVVAALWLLFNHTAVGRAMKAAAMEPRAAALCGVEVRTVSLLAFVIAGAIGGLAGALVAPVSPPFYENGVALGLKGFVAAIAGGLGNPVGAVLGGLLIGFVESFLAGYGLSGYKDAIAYLLLVGILILRPAGLLGRLETKRV